MDSPALAIRVATRYTRSVNLQRDFADVKLGLSGYQVTPLVLQTTGRVMAGLQKDATNRAFSIIGPYGSGKSAFGVFLASYLSYAQHGRESLIKAHSIAGMPDYSIYEGPSLLPILVSGNNSALRPAILHALYVALVKMPRVANLHREFLLMLHDAIERTTLDPQTVTDFVQQATRLVAEQGAYRGVALVIDELGQYLNYTTRHGDERDLFVLQTLAEMADRSGDLPCLIVTILHQSFDRYTGSSGPKQRVEWTKVQGRFVELPFQEPATQMVRMVARALYPDDEPLPTWRRDWGARLGEIADELGIRPADISLAEWKILVARAYPLHPTVLAALPLLFRQLAQNERSLFAFLSSSEPWGLQDFSSSSASHGSERAIYRLPLLYNYVEANLAASLFGRARGQRWAELAEARTLLSNSVGLAHDTLTAIGTLGALGQSRGLHAGRDHVAFALCDDPQDVQVGVALNLLEQRRLIIFRSHRQSYHIWEGSDLDLDDLTKQARRDLAGRVALVDLLSRYAETRPLVARRFSYQTGAMRLFAARFVDAANLPTEMTVSPQAEGEALYVAAADDEALRAVEVWATSPDRTAELLRVIVMPRRIEDLQDLALHVAALEQVLVMRPELEHDRAARREVTARLAEAQQALREAIVHVYGSGIGRWYWCGQERQAQTAYEVDELLSQACDVAFSLTPRIWNELIVRRQLSSAAAKARRMLLEAMLDQSQEERLGLQGYPPERAIYESVLYSSGIHREESDGVWGFGHPPANDPLRLTPAWECIEQYFDAAFDQPRPLLDLYRRLEAPPYGVKSGLLPLLFMAAYLANSGEVALYEHGSYVPAPDIALFERMLRQPGYFAVRRTRVSGVRVAVYERLARAMAPKALRKSGQPAILDAVTPLLRFVAALPAYVRRTGQVSHRAQSIRQALLTARAPDELLFELLPRACEMIPFAVDALVDDQQIECFFTYLREGLDELQQAYSSLVAHVVERIGLAFIAASTDPEGLREELASRYQRIAAFTSDNQIRALAARLEHTTAGAGWVESVAALVGRKPLDAWNDSDVTDFDLKISDLGRRFRLVEQIAVVAQHLPPETPVLRVGVADARGERSMVVHHMESAPEVHRLRDELSVILNRYTTLSRGQCVAAIAELLESLLDDTKEGISNE